MRILGHRRRSAEALRRHRIQVVQRAAGRALRQGIKEYSNWPTIPQLYVDGEFVGGCDIIREMYQTGELQQLLAKQPA